MLMPDLYYYIFFFLYFLSVIFYIIINNYKIEKLRGILDFFALILLLILSIIGGIISFLPFLFIGFPFLISLSDNKISVKSFFEDLFAYIMIFLFIFSFLGGPILAGIYFDYRDKHEIFGYKVK